MQKESSESNKADESSSKSSSPELSSLRAGKWSENPGELDEPPYDLERATKALEEIEALSGPEDADEEEPVQENEFDDA
jgi:hypothetical protein